MQKTHERSAVSLGDLAQLAMRANVAFAVRCAQRIRPRFKLPADVARRSEYLSSLADAIDVASLFCAGLPLEEGRIAATLSVVTATAEETMPLAGYAGYGAVRAVEAAAHAEEALRAETESDLLSVVAASFGAARVLIANAIDAHDLIVAALVADVEKLSLLAPAAGGDLGPAVDPSESGPLGSLWPAGAPTWFVPIESVQRS